MGALIAEGLRPVVDLVYPPRCPLCGDAIASQGGLCIECWSELQAPGEPACNTCSRPIASGGKARSQCWMCREDPPLHSGIVAASVYNDASRQLVLRFKHGGKIALAPLLAQMIAQHLDDAEGTNAPLLVPVPLHRMRLWERGFNQSALLARELARCGKGRLLVDGLVRQKRTPSLGGLGRDARRKALAGAIAVRESRRIQIEGSSIVLVDDVLTSGATSAVCVDALIKAGAASVRIACFSRVIDA